MRYPRMLIGSVLIGGLVAFAPAMSAQGPLDEMTYVTFSGPVDLPSVGLPAGTYIFRLADRNDARNVIQVLSADGSKVYAMVEGVPATRPESTDQVMATFAEPGSGAPPAVRTFFFPHDTLGFEFMYPTQQAKHIAKLSHQRMLTEDGTYVQ